MSRFDSPKNQEDKKGALERKGLIYKRNAFWKAD